MDRKEIYLDALSLTERVAILRKSGVRTVICGGISDLLANMLSGAEIALISDISGEIEQVLEAYRAKSLNDSRFLMPGAISIINEVTLAAIPNSVASRSLIPCLLQSAIAMSRAGRFAHLCTR